MKVRELSEAPSIMDDYLHELRNVKLQADRDQFRLNIKRIGRIIGYELSKELAFKKVTIETPLAPYHQRVLADEVVVITILRAGLPLHDGILESIPGAENGFISAYRKHKDDGSFHIEVGYVACPELTGKVLILNDPMLATGGSFETALSVLQAYGKPSAIHLAAVIASREGVEHLERVVDEKATLWVGVIDPELNDLKYIMPGLGDAGDLAFGPKLQR